MIEPARPRCSECGYGEKSLRNHQAPYACPWRYSLALEDLDQQETEQALDEAATVLVNIQNKEI